MKTLFRFALTMLGALVMPSGSLYCVKRERQALFETPEWAGNPAYEVGIRLRRQRADGGALLIKHDEREEVRRYSPEGGTMTVVGPADWERAEGAVAVCEQQFPPDGTLLRVDAGTGRLRDRQGEVDAVGGAILNLTASPRGDRVAVLSATGKKTAPPLPFWGGGGATGEYWHQVWSIRAHAFGGPGVKIPTLRARDSLRACWSADEKLIVYYEVTFAYLTVVAVN